MPCAQGDAETVPGTGTKSTPQDPALQPIVEVPSTSKVRPHELTAGILRNPAHFALRTGYSLYVPAFVVRAAFGAVAADFIPTQGSR